MNNGKNGGNAGTRLFLLALVACYIIYLGISILKSLAAGEKGMPAWAAVLFGVLFIAAGAGYLFYLYKQYRAMKAEERESAEELPAEASQMPAGESEAAGEGAPERLPAEAETLRMPTGEPETAEGGAPEGLPAEAETLRMPTGEPEAAGEGAPEGLPGEAEAP